VLEAEGEKKKQFSKKSDLCKRMRIWGGGKGSMGEGGNVFPFKGEGTREWVGEKHHHGHASSRSSAKGGKAPVEKEGVLLPFQKGGKGGIDISAKRSCTL